MEIKFIKSLINKMVVNNDKTGLGYKTNSTCYAGDLKKQSLRKREIQDG